MAIWPTLPRMAPSRGCALRVVGSSPVCLRVFQALAIGLVAASQQAGAQTAVNAVPLSFGSFTAGTGGGISVSAGSIRSPAGDVGLLHQGANATAALFNVSGTPGSHVSITLPADGIVFLVDSASHSMAINGFTKSSSVPVDLSSGSGSISVGATLTVGSRQAPGSYSGAFQITVVYE